MLIIPPEPRFCSFVAAQFETSLLAKHEPAIQSKISAWSAVSAWSALNLSQRYGHVTLVSGYLDLTGVDCRFRLIIAEDQVLVFVQIAGSCQLNLLKTGLDCSEAG